ncbi:MAG: hypothetical protein K0S38_251 [Candidatus Paceibacter sp.]|jgi:hypothetical protein|nr:hypothetical protein [Candidatus Paceibacter sp.]
MPNLIGQYLNHRRDKVSESTFNCYKSDLLQLYRKLLGLTKGEFVDLCADNTDLDMLILKFSSIKAEQFLTELSKRHPVSTVKRKKHVMHSFFEFLKTSQKGITTNPFAKRRRHRLLAL